MKANIIYILGIFIWLSLNACSKSGDDTSQQEYEQDIALSSLKNKSISLSLRDNEFVDKVRFDIGENIEYFKLSSEKARKVTEPYCEYSKKSSEESSLEIEFTIGNLYYYWEIHLEFKKENSGSYIGIVEYGDDENYKEETIYGTFSISDYSNEDNEEHSDIEIEYLTKNVWFSTETNLQRFFAFYDDCSYKHYCDLGSTIVKDKGGEYVFDEDEATLKLYNSNNKCEFDFKILKLTESELWLSVYDVIDKKYPSSPSMKLRIAKESDDIPRFILDKGNEVDDDFSISEPIIEDVNTNSVVVKGTIIGEGVNFKNRGLCISTKENPTVDDICITQNSNVINKTIKDLYPGTTYYVRLYAEVYNQIFYGDQVSFTTTGDKIEKIILTEILEVTNLERSQVHVKATLPYGVSKYGLCYGKNPNPQITDKVMAEADSKTSWILTGIECGHDYYVRAYHIEGSKVVYYEDSEIRIHPLNKKQLTYDFNYSISSSYNLSITFTEFPEGQYEVVPTVWRWKDAYYKEHEGKNYDQPKKSITIGKEPVVIKFSATLATKSHQMPSSLEDLNYHFDFLKIIPKGNDTSQKEWHITKEDL